MQILETGVPNLDLILGGGIPEGDVLLAIGPAGSGKTTLALQIALHTASAGENVLYISTASESPARIMELFRHFSIFDRRLIGKRLFMVSIYPIIVKELGKASDAIVQAVTEHQARLVVIDGLMSIRDLHPPGFTDRRWSLFLVAYLS